MADFRNQTAADVAAQVRSGASSARTETERALAAIAATNPTLHAFVAVDADRALADADAIDARLAAGEDVGPLAGVPLGVKDLEDAIGYTTTCGSALHAEDPPATKDSVLVSRLRAAGCVVVGKTNTPEFGWTGDTVNEIFPGTENPWQPGRSAGGSSGGTGAALAAGMVPLATGSDGGGSIRIPSAVNGLSGLKPSLGRVPLGGPKAPNWLHFSTPGPMARTVRDVALALDASVGPDPTDMHSLPLPKVDRWSDALVDVDAPRRVLWSPNLGYGTTDREILAVCTAAVERLAAAGVEVEEVDVFPADPAMDWATVAFSGLRQRLIDLEGTPAWETISPGLRSMVELIGSRTGVDVVTGMHACHAANYRLVELFHTAPILLSPTTAGQTGAVGAAGTIDGEETIGWVSYTYPFNMTGNPAGSICAGFTGDGMPVGLQIVGPRHADVAVLRAMAFLEDLLAVDTVAPLDWA